MPEPLILSPERHVCIPGGGPAKDYARALISRLGATLRRRDDLPVDGESLSPRALHPQVEWARSGAMSLSGRPDGPPRLAPGPLATVAQGALDAAAALLHDARSRSISRSATKLIASPFAEGLGPRILGERAAIFGYGRAGDHSPSGSCRLLETADGHVALNLARSEDISLLPAWLGEAQEPGDPADPWHLASLRLQQLETDTVVDRARLMGLPAAPVTAKSQNPADWLRLAETGPRCRRPSDHAPLVIDLSSLWAGPLCTSLLVRAGARVVKIESLSRPDGARRGPASFFDLLNAGKESVALDLTSAGDRARLKALLRVADVVVESARPRALRQLGIFAEEEIQSRPGLTWISITGYGREEPQSNWVAFGDDASAASGLIAAMDTNDEGLVFCGDAICDPLAGLHAAVAAVASYQSGGGHLVDLSLCEVTAWALGARVGPAQATGITAASVERVGNEWVLVLDEKIEPVASPKARLPGRRARALGQDSARVLAELTPGC